jgi:hypothetical protein
MLLGLPVRECLDKNLWPFNAVHETVRVVWSVELPIRDGDDAPVWTPLSKLVGERLADILPKGIADQQSVMRAVSGGH